MTEEETPDGGQGDRWSPFPVQDWSMMPIGDRGHDHREATAPVDDPSATDAASAVEPGRGRPTKAQPTSMIIVVLCVVLVGVGIGLSDRVGAGPVADGVFRFVPADGAAQSTSVRLSGSPGRTFTEVTESARYAGAQGVSSLDFALGSRVLATDDQIDKAPLWRTTTTRVGAAVATHQRVHLYRLSDGISLVAESGPDLGHVYRPALVELPADAVVGSRWTSRGTAGDGIAYRSDLRAEAAESGCLEVRGTIAHRTQEGRALPTRTVQKTWCKGRGIVSSVDSVPSMTRTEELLKNSVDHGDLSTVDKIITWGRSTVWNEQTYQVITDDPQFGPGQMTSAAASLAPGVTASGLQVRVTSSSHDVIAFGSRSTNQWQALRRMHPGGTVLRLAVFGNIVVVTTSARKVVAYSDGGVRLWEQELNDVVLTTPQRLSATQVVVAAVDGLVVALDLITGQRVWKSSIGTDVAAAPAIGHGAVAIAGRDGQVSILTAEAGRVIAQLEVSSPEAVAVIKARLVVRTEGYLEGFDLATGERRWRVVFGSIVDRIVPLGDLLVVAGREQTIAVDRDGRVRWRQHGFTDAITDGTSLIGLNGIRAERLDSTGTILSGFTIPANTATSTTRPVVSPGGVWLFGGGWEFTEYTHGR